MTILAAVTRDLDNSAHKDAASENCISYRPRLLVQEWARFI